MLVERYNEDFAGRRPRLTLPTAYSFDDRFFTQDVRVSRTFTLSSERVRLVLMGEVFNLFNAANLVQFSGNISNRATFGQPGARFDHVFGSGGPRAFQLGVRISF